MKNYDAKDPEVIKPALKSAMMKGFAWESLGVVLVQFIIIISTLIIANFVSLSEYGVVVTVMLIAQISMTFVTFGLYEAYVRLETVTDRDLNSIFVAMAVASIVIYAIYVLGLKSLSGLMGLSDIESAIPWLGLLIIFEGIGLPSRIKLNHELKFRTQSFANILAAIIASVTAISFAIAGNAYVALIIQIAGYPILRNILLAVFSGWFPGTDFDLGSLKDKFNFGKYIMLSKGTNVIFGNSQVLMVSALMGADLAGALYFAQKVRSVVLVMPNGILTKVSFPIFSHANTRDNFQATQPSKDILPENSDSLMAIYGTLLRQVSVVYFPVVILLSLAGQPLLNIVVSQEWGIAGEFLSIVAIGAILLPIHSLNINALNVLGQSKINFGISIFQHGLVVIALMIGAFYGIKPMLYSLIIFTFVNFVPLGYYIDKHLKRSFRDQLSAIVPILTLAIFSIFPLLLIRGYEGNLALIILSIICYLGLYALLLIFFKIVIFRNGRPYIE